MRVSFVPPLLMPIALFTIFNSTALADLIHELEVAVRVESDGDDLIVIDDGDKPAEATVRILLGSTIIGETRFYPRKYQESPPLGNLNRELNELNSKINHLNQQVVAQSSDHVKELSGLESRRATLQEELDLYEREGREEFGKRKNTQRLVVRLTRPIPEWNTDHALVRITSRNSKGWRFRVSVVGHLEAPAASAKTKEVTTKTYTYNDKGQRTKLIQEVSTREIPVEANMSIKQELSTSITKTAPGGTVTKTRERHVPKDLNSFPDLGTAAVGSGHSYLEGTTLQADNRTEDQTVAYDEQTEADGEIKVTTTEKMVRDRTGNVIDYSWKRTTTGKADEVQIRNWATAYWTRTELLPLTDIQTMGGYRKFQIPGRKKKPDEPFQKWKNEHQWAFEKID